MGALRGIKFVPSLEKQFSVDFMRTFRLPLLEEKIKQQIGNGQNLIIFLGSSGVGRDTVLENCLSLIKNSKRIRRTTTRLKRLGRGDQSRLIFVKKKSFLNALENGKILFACRYRANNEFYGISKDELLKLKNKRKIYFFECTLLSLPLKKILPKAKLILLVPPSLNFLKSRLKARGDKDWQKRFKTSCLEIKAILKNIKEMFRAGFIDLAFINSDSQKTAQKIKKALKNKKYTKVLWQEFFDEIKNYG
ncbi:MAG: hypothetical protein ACP5IX_02495 [Patescibacteria group bacterium]